MVALIHSSTNSSRCSTPTAASFSLSRPRKVSSNTLDQYSPLDENDRKISLTSVILKTKEGLGNLFASDEETPEELIYNLFKVPNKSDAFIGKLIMVLKNHGLRENDPRLAPMMRKIREIESEKEERSNEARDPKHWRLSKNDFKRCISESLSLIVQTMQGDLIVPAWGQFTNIIKEIYQECSSISTGKVADYIPQLARFKPEYWGVSICTVDGQRASFGDSNVPFCVQSVSKAFNYSIAASEHGAEFVHQYVGQEPSGRFFNEICLDVNNKPHNPMVNSGAIIVTSLIKNKMNIADRFEHMINEYRKISGGDYVGFNNAVYLSETTTADRNFALAYFMKENGCFPPETTNLKDALDFYFQLCSLEVTCESAAVMAATLANGGVCPLTGERCIGSRPCRDVLSLMNSCGMYDYSGQFAFHVGLPAKSGVSGIMIVVVPNLMGIALWSPPLDRMGNSVRGVEFCKRLVQRFNFHNYDSLVHNESEKFDPRVRVGEREKAAVVSLLFAAKTGDLNTIRRMYMQNVDLEMADYDKRTALHLAASEGHLDVAMFLLEIGNVKPDPKDRWTRTPLDDAREAGHLSVALLIERRIHKLEMEKCPGKPFQAPIGLIKASSLQLLPSQRNEIPESPSESANCPLMGTGVREQQDQNGHNNEQSHVPAAQESMLQMPENCYLRRKMPPSPLTKQIEKQNRISAVQNSSTDSGLSFSAISSTEICQPWVEGTEGQQKRVEPKLSFRMQKQPSAAANGLGEQLPADQSQRRQSQQQNGDYPGGEEHSVHCGGNCAAAGSGRRRTNGVSGLWATEGNCPGEKVEETHSSTSAEGDDPAAEVSGRPTFYCPGEINEEEHIDLKSHFMSIDRPILGNEFNDESYYNEAISNYFMQQEVKDNLAPEDGQSFGGEIDSVEEEETDEEEEEDILGRKEETAEEGMRQTNSFSSLCQLSQRAHTTPHQRIEQLRRLQM